MPLLPQCPLERLKKMVKQSARGTRRKIRQKRRRIGAITLRFDIECDDFVKNSRVLATEQRGKWFEV